jgi:competence protein ComEC
MNRNKTLLQLRVAAVLATLVFALSSLAACKADDAPPADTPTASQVSVLFINVGRADATLVQIDGLSYLIDTGTKEAVPALYTALEARGVTQLEAVFLTHTHKDHIGGMEGLVQRYPVKRLYSASISMNNKNGTNKIAALADDLSLDHVKLDAGDRASATPGVAFEVLGPLAYNDDDDNDNSLILRLRVNGRTFLFTGDMQFPEEKTLLDANVDLRADVLKVGNHGNPDATSDAFAKAVSPSVAVISTDTAVDKNSANARVRRALDGAQIHLTQDYRCGALIAVGVDGSLSLSDPPIAPAAAQLRIEAIDPTAQTLTLKNLGDDTDLGGFFILSERGSEIFVFPKHSRINAGETIVIACKGGAGDYIWGEKSVWHKSKPDAGILYDRSGNVLSRFE